MERLAESFEFALKLEREGRCYYLSAAERVKDVVIQSVLLGLADDELQHENAISRYYQALEKHQAWPTPDYTGERGELPGHLREILSGSVGNIGPDATFQNIYEAAYDLEVRSRDYYLSESGKTGELSVSKLFRFLAGVEEAHMKALDLLIRAVRISSRED